MKPSPNPNWSSPPAPARYQVAFFAVTPRSHDGVEGLFAVDLFMPGCPPHPYHDP